MSFNISNSILKHFSKVEATIDFNTMSPRAIAMVKTYVRTGVMRTTGVTAIISRYIRLSNGMQCVNLRSNFLFCRNIRDKEVFDAIFAAATLGRIEGADQGRCHVRFGDGTWVSGSLEKLLKTKPDRFSIWSPDLSRHFHLAKLSDTMEINTDEKLTVDLSKFFED